MVDLQVDEKGASWLTDATNARVTVVGPDGKLVRMIPVGNQIWTALPLPGGRILAKLPLRGPFYALLDSAGTLVRTLRVPPALTTLDYNQAVQSAAMNDAGLVVSALRWGSAYFVIEPWTSAVREYIGIDSVPPANAVGQRLKIAGKVIVGHRIDPRSFPVNQSADADADRVYLLIRGQGELAGRIIDQHRLIDGKYEGSYRLPSRAIQALRVPDGFALLIEDPVPRVDILEWVPSR